MRVHVFDVLASAGCVSFRLRRDADVLGGSHLRRLENRIAVGPWTAVLGGLPVFWRQ